MSVRIRTRYVGPRGFRGSVIVATGGGRQRTVGYDDARNRDDMHRHAALMLCERLGITSLDATMTTAATDDPTRYVHTVDVP